jgi:RNA polymerase sigma-70 factor (ECF subfamily)
MDPLGLTGTTVPATAKPLQGDAMLPRQLFPVIYDELRRVARNYMRRERRDHSLEPTALVHEAYTRLFKNREFDAITRTHFFRLSAQAMRQILVDHARARICQKRDGVKTCVHLVENVVSFPLTDEVVLQLHDAITELEKVAPRAAQIVDMRFFVGMKEEEIAEALEISGRTVKRDWTFARAWLQTRLSME